ncbi:hypothetical protein [Peptoniphilus sp. DNF00840]|uniref:hypothetical protein n=1 Tax=Peptoniphilus sp. DNF00840 TaxID=1477000 RepID=UPI00079671ED|nr:hypothetical protein [Peptoniphilus sp. DNF00840]KXB72278.1 hypothetical protein HMPREF1864_00131 [Peptoniphilus sp. DNF00840]
MLSYIEKGYLDELFNRGGYVLDFSTNDFDEFTFQSIGIRLCEKYHLSKGKSLREFTNEGDSYKIAKLYKDLLEFYSVYFSDEIEENKKIIEELLLNLYILSVKILLIENYQIAQILCQKQKF